MEKRKLEKPGIETSLLGFGCMRFPVTADGKIDEPEAERMLDKAIAAGVNYIDTAYPYHDGASEPFVGRALKKYDRHSFFLATKLPCWKVEKPEDVEATFQEQLGRLQTDYIDFYLMHALNKDSFHKMVELGAVEKLEALKAGDWEDWELQGARSSLLNSLRAIEDSAGALEDFIMGQTISGAGDTIEGLMKDISSVTGEQIQAAAQALELDTIYFLKGKEA